MTVLDMSDISPQQRDSPSVEKVNNSTPQRSSSHVESFVSPTMAEKTPDDQTSDLSSLLPLPQGGLTDIENLFINSVLESVGGAETDNDASANNNNNNNNSSNNNNNTNVGNVNSSDPVTASTGNTN